ncbi:YoaH family protein [Caviibacterium pharyngocola]|uniref:YoaH family protein n=1 Tax=Caviibacterium pharyngocola TaxID=28159 RepID=A0A2M8RUV3_9PAST|nr:YoaH family protein [Caviibacterium pharyngocola]PJG82672.1 YoaH family protein [Caviibacterium pharyngocola]
MSDNGLLHLTHEQQQAAAEKIRLLMEQGMGSGEAIALVAQELREKYTKSQAQEQK